MEIVMFAPFPKTDAEFDIVIRKNEFWHRTSETTHMMIQHLLEMMLLE
jgi:hypothetical protein